MAKQLCPGQLLVSYLVVKAVFADSTWNDITAVSDTYYGKAVNVERSAISLL